MTRVVFFFIRNVLIQLPTLLSAALNNIVPRTGKTKLHMEHSSKCSKSSGRVRSESEFLRSTLTLDLCGRACVCFGCSEITRLRCGEHEVNYKNAQEKICKSPANSSLSVHNMKVMRPDRSVMRRSWAPYFIFFSSHSPQHSLLRFSLHSCS
ncbi:hypothetical protein TRVL_09453 [Trypanosoma vivax]|nr:hypothetical protein TRVL_09453 [Trypanosoma vivax]